MTDPQPAVNALLRDFEAKRQARYEAASAEHFADPDAEIPDAEWRTPDCPICDRNTDFDDGTLYCEVCDVSWNRNGENGERGGL